MNKPKEPFSVLLVDSDETFFPQIKEELTHESEHPTHLDISKTVAEAIEKMQTIHYHVILASDDFPNGEDISDILKDMNSRKVSTPLIVMVPQGQEARAHRAVKRGATDYLIKNELGLRNLAQRLWAIYRNYELSGHHEDLKTQITHTNRKLIEVNEKLRELSIRDELTGLYNHRYLQERLVEEFTRAVRYSHPLSCLFIDLDLFRKVNDSLSHTVGDVILKEVAALLLERCRLSDLVARFGGEEFVIFLPHIDYEGAFELAERLREVIAEHTFLGDSHKLSLTVSIGVSCFPDDPVKHRSDLLNFADQALFRAKAGGRNLVSLYRDALPALSALLPHLKISEEQILDFQRKLSNILDNARRSYLDASKAMIMALESKDSFTAGHSARVASLSLQIARAMDFSLDEAEIVEHAALLHDIGKICISDEILLKPGQLTLTEYEAMKQHPYFGYRILKPIKFLQREATFVLHHHEWFNGEGYPCRLAGNEIPLGSRIISVVDSYDTMRVAGGRYKKTIPVETAVNEIITCTGSQFDPEVVQAFVQVLLMRKELAPDSYDKKRLEKVLETHSSH